MLISTVSKFNQTVYISYHSIEIQADGICAGLQQNNKTAPFLREGFLITNCVFVELTSNYL